MWEEKPLSLILFLAIIARLIAVAFSKGWGMLDDHFLVIEVAQSWADGYDVNHWLPWTQGNSGPEGHSFFYVGMHYFLFVFLKFIGLSDPQGKMFLVRFLHAAWSLLVVYYGYKITERTTSKKTAKQVGLILALLWFIPWMSVRNLVEVAAIPLLIISTWMAMVAEEKKHALKFIFLAGFVGGIAFSVRYQTAIFTGGIGLAILLNRKWKEGIFYSVGALFSALLLQGGIDLLIWGRPFAEMGEYIQFNLDNKYNFIQGDWYNYLLLLGGILIPPISIFIFFGMFSGFRKRLILFLPMFLFLAFHSYFPNKQERFIFSIVPSLVIAGITGWNEFKDRSVFWLNHARLYKKIWTFFWVLNFMVFIPVSTMYGKRSRVEAMYQIHRYKDIREIVVENSDENYIDIMPQFYAGQMISTVGVTRNNPLSKDSVNNGKVEENAQFVFFVGDKNLQNRKKKISQYYPNLVYEATAEPGFVDMVMYRLNPSHNTNHTIYIYRNRKFFPDKIED
ncbi:MAG: glycosyltransferase family 39 protein [Bacteroidetes bacterium]|nr:glycosyltransferase family 39 protein [Bacteroidota bacterium]